MKMADTRYINRLLPFFGAAELSTPGLALTLLLFRRDRLERCGNRGLNSQEMHWPGLALRFYFREIFARYISCATLPSYCTRTRAVVNTTPMLCSSPDGAIIYRAASRGSRQPGIPA